MWTSFGDLVEMIDKLGSSRATSWVDHAASVLRFVRTNPLTVLFDHLDRMGRLERSLLAEQSFDRDSHYKMFLLRSNLGWEAWLHFYKSDAPAARWARSIHDHRFGFASRIITG
jgi:hypothetical protein